MTNKLNALVVIVAGGALDAIATELIDKGKDFNFTGSGFQHLLSVAIVGGIITLAAWYRSRHVTHKHYADHATQSMAKYQVETPALSRETKKEPVDESKKGTKQ